MVHCARFSELLPTGDKKKMCIGIVFMGLSFVKLRPAATDQCHIVWNELKQNWILILHANT